MPPYQRLRLEKKRVASVTLVEVARKERASVTEKKITNDNDWSLKVATSNATTGVNKSNYYDYYNRKGLLWGVIMTLSRRN